MAFSRTSLRRRPLLAGLLAAALLGGLAPAAGAAGAPPASDPARELARTAEPFTDLRPLDRMVGSAKVVGIGEATHSSAEFFEAKHRIFEHLVERRGFTTFALEANWSTGLLVDAWVRTGAGDIREIMRDEFQESYRLWNTEEYLDLFRWMRRHNQLHPEHQVRFMGNDLGYAGPNLFDTVTSYVARTHPALLPRFRELYRASRPSGDVETWMKGYMARPLPERRRMAAEVNRALALLGEQRPARDPRAREAAAWAVQHARAIAQVGTEYAHDMATDAGIAEAMLYRDRVMAENTVWWQRRTGDRIVLSAHNGHVGYETPRPDQYPRLQGAFLRDALGRDYVSVGASFGRGSFNAHDTEAPGEPLRAFTVGPLGPDSTSHTLDRVSPGAFYLDLRRTTPAARDWLSVPRPTRSIGTAYPWAGDLAQVRLSASYDLLLHFPRITAARLR
ncbi:MULTISPECIES: erythromycin esterase family protein [unclassified Streptomyces]|uniref:erythromycin esterase family protein n=1 Tax=unclassified Streptomyces TaxID=2593676 RepID=UPI0007010605|nr:MULTISPECIES: erythromycin esterase family protein [unclassified Streptomyces]KQX47810.1 erythromycin esterase [Streptomyces sp. Root1304]KRA82202.1 erythromycin esterase [Streptomyces sp. Root66D1]